MGGSSSSSSSSSVREYRKQTGVYAELVKSKNVETRRVWLTNEGSVVMPVDLPARVISKDMPSHVWLFDLTKAKEAAFKAFFDAVEQELESMGDYLPVAPAYTLEWVPDCKICTALHLDMVHSTKSDAKRVCRHRLNELAFEWNRKEFWKLGCEANVNVFMEERMISDPFGVIFRKLGPSEQAEKLAAFSLAQSAAAEGIGLSPAAPLSTVGYAPGTEEVPPYSGPDE